VQTLSADMLFAAHMNDEIDAVFAPIDGLLTPDAWHQLRVSFPDPSLFAPHSGVVFVRPGEPVQLHLLDLVDHDAGLGEVTLGGLAAPWRAFVEQLRTHPGYRALLARCAGTGTFRLRCSWHLRGTRSTAPPHRDADQKLATHLFYFVGPDEWDAAWGGETIFLGGRDSSSEDPATIEHFSTRRVIPCLGNKSLLFRNTALAWHCVLPLGCPPGVLRRTFNVFAEIIPEDPSQDARERE